MILRTLIALIGMSAVGWFAWRMVSRQETPSGMDEQDATLRAKRQRGTDARQSHD